MTAAGRGHVVIVGSGLTGALIAWSLVRDGFQVTVIEKGPDTPHPRSEAFTNAYERGWSDPAEQAAPDLAAAEQEGTYMPDLSQERPFRLGGAASSWEAITPRMRPSDFRTRSLFGYGVDWPIGYADLEPWYERAESLLGVAGASDDPAAHPRRTPFPHPAHPLTPDDEWLAARLARGGIRVHTTPQARPTRERPGRPACRHIGYCFACPLGSRYAPRLHLDEAAAAGRCRVVVDTGVRRIVSEADGRVRSVVVRGTSPHSPHGGARDEEIPADAVVLAAGAVEVPRILLLSRDERHPDGLGNAGGQVGRGLVLHRIWDAEMIFDDPFSPARTGAWTGSIHQFLDPPGRGRHGGLKVECASRESWRLTDPVRASDGAGARRLLERQRRRRRFGFHAESIPSEASHVGLGLTRDRWGDPVARIVTGDTAFDAATYAYARDIFDRMVAAADPQESRLAEFATWTSGCHHMGTTAMGEDPGRGVADSWGLVHGTRNLYTAGPGLFAGESGALNPGLTAAALALRTAARIRDAG